MIITIKGLSMWQPHATLVAIGAKQVETRPKDISYRGWLVIQATRDIPNEFPAFHKNRADDQVRSPAFAKHLAPLGYQCVDDMPRGAAIAIAKLTSTARIGPLVRGAIQAERGDDELAYGNYADGRVAIRLEAVTPLPQPIPCRGDRTLWTVPPEVFAEIKRQFKECYCPLDRELRNLLTFDEVA